MKEEYPGQIEALKVDLSNAVMRLHDEKRNLDLSLRRMLDIESTITYLRDKLYNLGLTTIRNGVYGNIEYRKRITK